MNRDCDSFLFTNVTSELGTWVTISAVASGWGGGIRTPECQDQNLVPYHLATSQYALFYNTLISLYSKCLYYSGFIICVNFTKYLNDYFGFFVPG